MKDLLRTGSITELHPHLLKIIVDFKAELRATDLSEPHKSAKQTVITAKLTLSLRNHHHMTYTTGEKMTSAHATSSDDFYWLEKTFLYAEGTGSVFNTSGCTESKTTVFN